MGKSNISNANIFIKELNLNAKTDSSGNCSFDVPSGTYTAVITHNDFESKTVTVTVGSSDKSEQIEVFRKSTVNPTPSTDTPTNPSSTTEPTTEYKYNVFIKIIAAEPWGTNTTVDNIRDGRTNITLKDSSNNLVELALNQWEPNALTSANVHSTTTEYSMKKILPVACKILTSGNYTLTITREGFIETKHTFFISLNNQRKVAHISATLQPEDSMQANDFIYNLYDEETRTTTSIPGQYIAYNFKYTDGTTNKTALDVNTNMVYYNRSDVNDSNANVNQMYFSDAFQLSYGTRLDGYDQHPCEVVKYGPYITNGVIRIDGNSIYAKQYLPIQYPYDSPKAKEIQVVLTRLKTPTLVWED